MCRAIAAELRREGAVGRIAQRLAGIQRPAVDDRIRSGAGRQTLRDLATHGVVLLRIGRTTRARHVDRHRQRVDGCRVGPWYRLAGYRDI